MPYNPEKHHRQSIRLRGYDYTQSGAYFVTIITQNRAPILASVRQKQAYVSEAGNIVQQTWQHLPNHYANLVLDAFIIMPDHVHAIMLLDRALAGKSEKKLHGLSEIVRAFKTFSARQINLLFGTPGVPVWQRNYFERIIRNDQHLHYTRRYIERNPLH